MNKGVFWGHMAAYAAGLVISVGFRKTKLAQMSYEKLAEEIVKAIIRELRRPAKEAPSPRASETVETKL